MKVRPFLGLSFVQLLIVTLPVEALSQTRQDSIAILANGLAFLSQEYAMGDAVILDSVGFRPRELMTSVARELALPLGSTREVVECVLREPRPGGFAPLVRAPNRRSSGGPGPCRMKGGATGVFSPISA